MQETTESVHMKKPKTITKLRKELWAVFSKWIKARDKNICFTCGRHAIGSAMHSGHFITGATCTAKLYFDETNVHAQCYHCNINLSGNWVIYEKNMITKYGLEYVENLKARRTLESGDKVPSEWYEEKINHYSQLVQDLSTGLGCCIFFISDILYPWNSKPLCGQLERAHKFLAFHFLLFHTSVKTASSGAVFMCAKNKFRNKEI